MDETRRFDTFIFDLDGTLLDTVPDLTLLTNRILQELDCPQHTQAEILSYVGAGVRRLMHLALPEDAPQELVDRAMELWNSLFHEYYHETFPYPGVPEMLHELRLRGCRLGVVSNKLQAGVDQIMATRLPNMVDVMYGESPLVPRKPDPTGLVHTMKMLKTAPVDSIYVGDSPNDIVAAHRAGMTAAAVLWGYHAKEDFIAADAQPELFVGAPEELLFLAIDRRADAHLDGIEGAALT